LKKTYSGGCIRLATEDAKKVFEFARRGTPILIYENKEMKSVSPLIPVRAEIPAPEISAEGAMVADLDTGDILLNKNADMPLPMASLTKLMTAVVGSELIYLERGITIRSSMMQDAIQSYPLILGKEYKAFDLFYPLLMQSSNGSSRAIASFIGGGEFVHQMNEKAKTLGMGNSAFVDPAGIGDENVGTMKDIAKLMKYIADKRNFIFDITKGKRLVIFSEGELSHIQNYNEFASDARLIGMKNGKTSGAGESLGAVFLLKSPAGGEHRIFVGVLKSENRKTDIEKLLSWTESSFGLK
jgi:D-alanyl-D-alanine carboxypeptidase